MKKLLLAAAIVSGSCSLAMAQGGTGTSGAGSSAGQGTSSTPALQNSQRGMSTQGSSDRPVAMHHTKAKKKKHKAHM